MPSQYTDILSAVRGGEAGLTVAQLSLFEAGYLQGRREGVVDGPGYVMVMTDQSDAWRSPVCGDPNENAVLWAAWRAIASVIARELVVGREGYTRLLRQGVQPLLNNGVDGLPAARALRAAHLAGG